MASPTLKELKFRKFDELMDEVNLDLSSFAREGMIEPGQLIKVAQRVNYELGLKIHGTKETLLDVEFGRAKLPADFYILNHALLCHHYNVVESGLFNGIQSENRVTPVQNPNSIPQLTTCPCWKIDNIQPDTVTTKYIDCSGTPQIITFPANSTTNICATSIDTAQQLQISTSTFCYNIPTTGQLSCTLPDNCACDTSNTDTCDSIDTDPWNQNRVFTTCNGTMNVNVIEYHSNQVRRYDQFEQIQMVPSKEASAFCINTQFRNTPHQGHIQNGHIYIPTMRDNGNNGHARVYICYLGAMEDADGNLMVLDHPKINEYYEWAMKARIFENIYLNGEPDMERRLQMVKTELKTARAEALSIATMPDFYELKSTIEMNRRAQYHKYMHPFSSLYANTPGWPWSINSEYI